MFSFGCMKFLVVNNWAANQILQLSNFHESSNLRNYVKIGGERTCRWRLENGKSLVSDFAFMGQRHISWHHIRVSPTSKTDGLDQTKQTLLQRQRVLFGLIIFPIFVLFRIYILEFKFHTQFTTKSRKRPLYRRS